MGDKSDSYSWRSAGRRPAAYLSVVAAMLLLVVSGYGIKLGVVAVLEPAEEPASDMPSYLPTTASQETPSPTSSPTASPTTLEHSSDSPTALEEREPRTAPQPNGGTCARFKQKCHARKKCCGALICTRLNVKSKDSPRICKPCPKINIVCTKHADCCTGHLCQWAGPNVRRCKRQAQSKNKPKPKTNPDPKPKPSPTVTVAPTTQEPTWTTPKPSRAPTSTPSDAPTTPNPTNSPTMKPTRQCAQLNEGCNGNVHCCGALLCQKTNPNNVNSPKRCQVSPTRNQKCYKHSDCSRGYLCQFADAAKTVRRCRIKPEYKTAKPSPSPSFAPTASPTESLSPSEAPSIVTDPPTVNRTDVNLLFIICDQVRNR